MADDLCGTWKIVECVSLTGATESTGIEGTEFHLDESGDVTWNIPDEAESMPFFSCETYEISNVDPPTLKFFGAFAGHVIEFKIMKDENPEMPEDLMLLTYEQCCMLQCQKMSNSELKNEVPFSFLSALEEGYFSNITIRAETGKEFSAHKTILSLSAPEINWSGHMTPLDGKSEDVIAGVLHFLYSESLPTGFKEETAHAIIKDFGKITAFKKLVELCETFLTNTALRQQITNLVNDMHVCADRIIDLFSGKTNSTDSQFPSCDDRLLTNPAKLVYVFKQSMREAAVASIKLIILCDLFSRRSRELSREERHAIIKYAKSRLPVFMMQLRRFLEVCKQQTNSLSASQRHEIAAYLIPEVEESLDLISVFVKETRTALDQVITINNAPDKMEKSEKLKKGKVGDVLSKSLRNALHMRELKKLKLLHEKTSTYFTLLMTQKESYAVTTEEEKVRAFSKKIEQLVDEVPLFLTKIEDILATLDEKISWREWKYIFKLGTSKVAWVLNKTQTHRSTLQSLLDQACSMVQRDQFTASMVNLGLLDLQHTTTEGATAAAPYSQKAHQSSSFVYPSVVGSLCVPPYAKDSELAKNCLELLTSGQNTDMVFEVIHVQEGGDTVIDHTNGESYARTDRSKEVDIFKVPAHCVIIAARCDWFRRALLSGMRESIDKKITVHDINASLFQLFLVYLYSGQLDTSELSPDQIADMLALADRYEVDSLKTLCEQTLKQQLDEESAIYFLSLADQFNAKMLKVAALNFITDLEHQSLLTSDVFTDLPEHLQAEVESAISWHGPDPSSRASRLQMKTETQSSLSSASEMEELMTSFDLAERHDLSTSSSSEELHLMGDQARLEMCLSELRDIVGEDVPREELVTVALAADYDVNRAINFFFAS